MPNIVHYQEEINLNEEFTIKEEFKFTKNPLSWEEKRMLRRKGIYLQALLEKTIISIGVEDQHFVEVCKNNGEPTTPLERAWLRYHAALEEEERLKAKWFEEKKNSTEYEEYLKSRF